METRNCRECLLHENRLRWEVRTTPGKGSVEREVFKEVTEVMISNLTTNYEGGIFSVKTPVVKVT